MNYYSHSYRHSINSPLTSLGCYLKEYKEPKGLLAFLLNILKHITIIQITSTSYIPTGFQKTQSGPTSLNFQALILILKIYTELPPICIMETKNPPSIGVPCKLGLDLNMFATK